MNGQVWLPFLVVSVVALAAAVGLGRVAHRYRWPTIPRYVRVVGAAAYLFWVLVVLRP